MVQNPRESVHKHCAHPRGNEITRTQLSASHDRTPPADEDIYGWKLTLLSKRASSLEDAGDWLLYFNVSQGGALFAVHEGFS